MFFIEISVILCEKSIFPPKFIISSRIPVIIEQGKCVDERKIDVENFWQHGKLNKFSNVQFGEGGAGTFSDGKLNSNTSNEITKKVINVSSAVPKT